MDVNFQQVGNYHEAEFTVTSDFNLHLEKEKAGDTRLYVKGVPDGEYAALIFPSNYLFNKVIDYDLSALVYPKYIKIQSDVPVTSCVVTSK